MALEWREVGSGFAADTSIDGYIFAVIPPQDNDRNAWVVGIFRYPKSHNRAFTAYPVDFDNATNAKQMCEWLDASIDFSKLTFVQREIVG